MFIINTQIVYRREFDGSAILFNPDNDDVFALNRTGAEIYEMLQQGLEREAILAQLAAKTSLPPEAEEDFDAFIETLRSKGCIAPDDDGRAGV